jgi:hypothetical protein
MPQRFSFTQTITQTTEHGTERTQRAYTITYVDDPPERSDAIKFLATKAAHDKTRYPRLLPEIHLPPEVEAMSQAEAQAYLDAHPQQQRWSSLNITYKDMVSDHDLARLEHLPEIQQVRLMSSRITNRGVQHLRHLTDLKSLVLYSRKITTACLPHIARLKNLEMLDLSLCPFVSRAAFLTTAAQLPRLIDSFAPRKWPLTPLVHWYCTEWRIQRAQRNVPQNT